VKAPKTDEEREARSRFLSELCQWDVPRETIEKARADIRAAHNGTPRVLDCFAGGGSIPLEALRLGCEAYALDLNPVAYLIEKATVEYPQKFGRSLATDVRVWAEWVIKNVERSTADVYPRIPLPSKLRQEAQRQGWLDGRNELLEGLVPFLFLWARTVPCPNRQCGATVPLYGQTWLRKKSSGYVALRPRGNRDRKRTTFTVVEADDIADLDFDPSEGMKGTATTCLCCRSAVPATYVRSFGEEHGYGQQLMCVATVNPFGSGKLYFIDDSWVEGEAERTRISEERSAALERDLQVTTLDEVIPPTGNAGLATGKSYLYGISRFRQAYTPRQRYVLLECAREIRRALEKMQAEGMPEDRATAIAVYLGLWLSRLTDRFNGLARWDNSRETVVSLTSMKRIAMTWDFPEINIFGGASGDARGQLDYVTAVIEREADSGKPATVYRGSATQLGALGLKDQSFDAVITDPPYYDNESYSELSDVFYVWLKPAVGHLFPEHFAGKLTPKRSECVAAAYRQGGKEPAKQFFESCLGEALKEMHRVLKPEGILVLIYAHKTTHGWATLVNALRTTGFEVREAWPIETEAKARAAHQGDAALASSIFLAARPRQSDRVANYEADVRPFLDKIARERVQTLWASGRGLGGADLLLAAVGAGLRAYTQHKLVEYSNGEAVSPEQFLLEVESVVLDTLLKEVFGFTSASVSGVDRLTRFYILWRFTYRDTSVDAGEAFVFCYSQRVDIDGPDGIVAGDDALAERITKGGAIAYRLRNFEERGDDERLGVLQDSQPAPLVDVLHRLLWLMENASSQVIGYLRKSQVNLEQLRLVAQALAGPVLRGAEREGIEMSAELAAITKLTANWRTVVEDAGMLVTEAENARFGQGELGLDAPRRR
jgi:putative DNA methylase